MGLKAIAFVGLLLTMFLLIPSQVAEARQFNLISTAQVEDRQIFDFTKTVRTLKTDQYEDIPTYPQAPCKYGC
ncbi:hypothetical protein AAHA92_20040 [Salvia divinorum]|uniref:Uncharacterized protein n=1 Tax=Salvia divinorum TaxID=28513 RepID=A0ABD1GFY2_SALDI